MLVRLRRLVLQGSLLRACAARCTTGSAAATSLATTATTATTEWRRCRVRRILYPVGEVALHGVAGGLCIGPAEWPAADEIGRVRHHQPEICRGGATPIARVGISEVRVRRLAPVRAVRECHRVAADRDDRVIGRHRVEH